MDENMVMENEPVEFEVVKPIVLHGFASGCKKLNVRTRPSKSADVMVVIDAGTEVEIYETLKNWYKITLASGVTGYCMREYICLR